MYKKVKNVIKKEEKPRNPEIIKKTLYIHKPRLELPVTLFVFNFHILVQQHLPCTAMNLQKRALTKSC